MFPSGVLILREGGETINNIYFSTFQIMGLGGGLKHNFNAPLHGYLFFSDPSPLGEAGWGSYSIRQRHTKNKSGYTKEYSFLVHLFKCLPHLKQSPRNMEAPFPFASFEREEHFTSPVQVAKPFTKLRVREM